MWPKGAFHSKIDDSFVFKYEEILDFEVIEDGNTVTKGGLGKALVGGAIFGVAGAIVGGTSKKTNQICTQLQIKVKTKDSEHPVIYLNLINSSTKKDSWIYKQKSKQAQDIISKFKIIADKLSEGTETPSEKKSFSIADEIKKFKELLDSGAIPQEEFDKKKKELLS